MSGPPDYVDLTAEDDEEDEDLKRAIELSLQDLNQDQQQDETKPSTAKAEQQQSNGLLGGLDRKTMEAERLARLKRKREDENSGSGSGSEAVVATTTARDRGLYKGIDSSTTAPAPAPVPLRTKESTSTTSPSEASKFRYHKGVVLKTYAAGYSTDRTITFKDLIAPAATLKSCLLSSFIWDFDWLFPHFNTKGTNFLLVMQAKYARDRQQTQNDFAGIGNIRLCFPPMEGQVNCMHSKLMLLFWHDRCRIVVPTANLTSVDWGVGSVMENMVWLIDLPRLSPDLVQDEQPSRVEEIPFKRSLKTFLSAQTVPGEVLSKLDLFDFRETRPVGFVHSIGGSHSGNESRQTGHCGLAATVSQMGLANTGPIEVDFVTSSIGNLNDGFMTSMYLAMQGNGGTKSQTKSKTGQNLVKAESVQDWRGRFRVYFPSLDAVKASNGGPSCAGTICFSEKWWEAQTFPRTALRDCVSVRDGLLMHNKIILVRFCNPKKTSDGTCMGYAYVGSANLSESAWGKLVKGTEHKQNLRNWEAGIILPFFEAAPEEAKAKAEKTEGLVPASGVVPIPMEFPGRVYESPFSLKPWFFGSP